MKLNRFTLNFSDASSFLEEPFRIYYSDQTQLHVRIALLTSILIYAAFGVLDALFLSQYKHITWFIRYAFVCPVLLATLALTYAPQVRHRYMQPILSCAVIVCGLGLLLMILFVPEPRNDIHYAGLVMVTTLGYLFVSLRFVWASLSGWLILLLYEITAFISGASFLAVIRNNFFLISTNAACMVICYMIEYERRHVFFLMEQLNEDQRKIQETNELLETRVTERTEELSEVNRRLFEEINERNLSEQERRSLQERLHRAEKMEALGTLAGGVAHDLNNVLSIVVGFAELLLDDVDKASPIRPRLQNILDGGEKAAAIVQDLLTLARRGVPSRWVLNLNTIVRDHQKSPEFKRLSAFHPSVRIQTDLEPDILSISGSPVHLEKTLYNLVSNAVESMPQGGALTIRTANHYLDKPLQGYDEVKEGDYVVLSVSDAGEGIPAADMKRIFEPFYTKKVMGRSGTGLGLAVVWGTVKDHNGYIDVQSEEGKGSLFTLYFPVTRNELDTTQAHAPVSDYLGHGESILVVDDVKGQRELAIAMLKKLNYNVVTVSSGKEALDYLEKNEADLVVLDMIMDTGMDGLDTYKGILAIRPGQKAIIVSGFSETDRVMAAQALGAGAYVKKPYVLEKLGLAVNKELKRSR